MAQVTPLTALPADSDTTGAVQITGASLRCSVRATALTTLALIRMDPSGKWFRITDETGAPMQFTAAPGGDAGNLDVSFTLPAASSNEYYNLIADSTFAGYAEIDSLSAPPGPGGSVPTARTLTPAGGVTLDGATSAVDLSADRTIGLGGTANMTLSTGNLGWAGAASKTGSLIAGTSAAFTLGANAVAVVSVDAGGLGLVLAANKNLSGAAGTGSVSLGSMSGTITTPTGLNTMSGDVLLAAGKVLGFGAPQALSGAGACNVTTVATLFTSTGAAQALTLADGTRAGQLKFVSHVVDGGSGVLTPTTKTGFSTVTLTAVNDWVCLIWSGSAWFVLAYSGATIA